MSLTLSALKKLEDKGHFPRQAVAESGEVESPESSAARPATDDDATVPISAPVEIPSKETVAWTPTSTEPTEDENRDAETATDTECWAGQAERVRDEVESLAREIATEAFPPSTRESDSKSQTFHAGSETPTERLLNDDQSAQEPVSSEQPTSPVEEEPPEETIDTQDDAESWPPADVTKQIEEIQAGTSPESLWESMMESAPPSPPNDSAEAAGGPTDDALPAYAPVIQPLDDLTDDIESDDSADEAARASFRDALLRQPSTDESPAPADDDLQQPPTGISESGMAPIAPALDTGIPAEPVESVPAILPTTHERSLLRELENAEHQQVIQDLYGAIEARFQFRFPESLMVCAPEESTRTADTIERLAIQLSRSGLKTLILDANVEAPALTERFEAVDAPGFTDFEVGDDFELVRATSQERLYLLPAGRRVSEWISGEGNTGGIVPLFATLQNSFDRILVDAGAMTGRSLHAFGELCVASLLVVSCPAPTEQTLTRAGELLADLPAQSLGCVVTDGRESAPATG